MTRFVYNRLSMTDANPDEMKCQPEFTVNDYTVARYLAKSREHSRIYDPSWLIILGSRLFSVFLLKTDPLGRYAPALTTKMTQLSGRPYVISIDSPTSRHLTTLVGSGQVLQLCLVLLVVCCLLIA